MSELTKIGQFLGQTFLEKAAQGATGKAIKSTATRGFGRMERGGRPFNIKKPLASAVAIGMRKDIGALGKNIATGNVKETAKTLAGAPGILSAVKSPYLAKK